MPVSQGGVIIISVSPTPGPDRARCGSGSPAPYIPMFDLKISHFHRVQRAEKRVIELDSD